MSAWTYVNGMIEVSPNGRTQPEKRYILETVLEHLPRVTGSEGDMNIYIIQENGHNSSCNVDEFQNHSNLGKGRHGFFELQSKYILVIEGHLRDREFETTLKEFNKWMCRLAKRIYVEAMMVNISNGVNVDFTYKEGYGEARFNANGCYNKMYEYPPNGESWTDYLMWQFADSEQI